MSTAFLRRLPWLLAAGLPLLLGGCHSAQPAFSFRPAAALTTAVPVAAPPADSAAAGPATPRPRTAPVPALPRRPAPATAAAPGQRPQRPAAASQRLRLPRPFAQHSAARRPATPARAHDTLHIVLGSVLIVGSVLIGLWLGGWLGLGVGAAIMLLGDYFLVLGIGGKHAWQEIFQEFFNM